MPLPTFSKPQITFPAPPGPPRPRPEHIILRFSPLKLLPTSWRQLHRQTPTFTAMATSSPCYALIPSVSRELPSASVDFHLRRSLSSRYGAISPTTTWQHLSQLSSHTRRVSSPKQTRKFTPRHDFPCTLYFVVAVGRTTPYSAALLSTWPCQPDCHHRPTLHLKVQLAVADDVPDRNPKITYSVLESQ